MRVIGEGWPVSLWREPEAEHECGVLHSPRRHKEVCVSSSGIVTHHIMIQPQLRTHIERLPFPPSELPTLTTRQCLGERQVTQLRATEWPSVPKAYPLEPRGQRTLGDQGVGGGPCRPAP